MIILGLTGSIGMGKSTAAATLQRLKVPLYDADATVHGLLAPGGAAVEPVETAFPGVRNAQDGIDRQLLGQRVFGNPTALRRLEGIIHPMIRHAEKRLVAQARVRREKLVVLDIPLLFETGSVKRCDLVLVVSAPPRVQRERVMRRPGMTESRFAGIRRAQMPDHEKRRRADFVVQTALGRWVAFRQLKAIVRVLRQGGSPPHACSGERGRGCAKL
ncbi:MAG TPA: dephospho-CoA kinase [Stellaceae bacterium]|nr:dephospho-CoA kinase [Stellaceae bacterium]